VETVGVEAVGVETVAAQFGFATVQDGEAMEKLILAPVFEGVTVEVLTFTHTPLEQSYRVAV
jgi:hypothetical protein